MHTIDLLGHAVLFRRRAAQFEIESPGLALPCKEAAFAYSEAARYGMSYVESKINNPSLAQRHGALADMYSQLAECRKTRVGNSTSLIAPNEEELLKLEKVKELLREEENRETSSAAVFSPSASSLASLPSSLTRIPAPKVARKAFIESSSPKATTPPASETSSLHASTPASSNDNDED